MNKRKLYPPLLLIFIFSILFFSCKKTEIVPTENVVERFLKVPSNATPQIERIIADLRKKNEEKPFIETFVARHGYPIWQYAKTAKPRTAPSIYASQIQEELLEVPVVKDMAEYVNAILNIKIDVDIFYKLFERNAWETYGFNKAPERTSPSADDVVRKIMEFEKEIWAEDIYKISDNRLFDYWPADIVKPSSFYVRSNITVDGITVIHLYEECTWNTHGEVVGVAPGDNISYAPETGLCLITTIIIDDNPWGAGGGEGWVDFPGGSINSSNIGSWDNGGAGGGGAGAAGEGPCDPDFKWTRLQVRSNNQLFNPCLEEVIYFGEANNFPINSESLPYGMGPKPIKEYSTDNRCAGLQAMWNDYPNNEAVGFVTKDGKLIVTGVVSNDGGGFKGLYRYANPVTELDEYYYTYPVAEGAPSLIYDGMLTRGDNYFIPVSASVHTHTPCRADGTNGVSHTVSDADQDLATKYPALKNWVIGCDAIAQFDNSSSNFFNTHTGPISTTCSFIP